MDLVAVFKALANQTRLNMIKWLKDPHVYFPAEELGPETDELGVCVSDIARKAGLTQSTTSDYLNTLQNCKLVTASRRGQWTYYKRNEEAIKQLASLLEREI
jgi:ArsR family transcriptional regulator